MTAPSPRAAAAQRPRRLPVWPLYLVGLTPALWGFYLGATNQLGADPVKSFEHMLGLWAVRFLILTLAVTPLRETTGINLIRWRRALGLLCFWFALFHFTAYLLLDLRALQLQDAGPILADIAKRPFLLLGFAAFVMLVPLAVTSGSWAIRRLGSGWGKLHRLIYPAAVCGAIHLLLAAKTLRLEEAVYLLALILLLLWRLIPRARRRTLFARAGKA
ncbi:protein-methionine-sulfoxide reductase heme-binding subunit MsrQ [Neomegalonema sp.]|uniref:protein-methionine-sulfoxide reductase heme-binding subunit MsrQ n=1 Tax=Neomegalonema sp. TaxID=2039713 RepID=UPI00262E10E8|nr:protein-methionine-sulfoxide reductase heme-binding subunit MsrQ [Neomegalonema sp.]MDD2868031.1 protein-methionine-sulfoxide reductase heme-binding subunit MsrQ [Neomegalonema sp.]